MKTLIQNIGINETYMQVLFAFTLAFVASVVLIPLVIRFSNKFQLVDKPNERKVHKSPIPTLGGIAILIGALLTYFIVDNNYSSNIIVCIIASISLFIMGIADDLFDISAKLRLVIQFIAGYLIYWSGIGITSFYGVLGIYELPALVSLGLNILFISAIMNAYNLIDGIDGLAGGLGAIGFIVSGILLLGNGDFTFAILAFSFAGSIAGFLIFNFNPAKIFMGDTGSIIIGFNLAICLIRMINVNESNVFISQNQAILLSLGILFIPVFDMFRVFIGRMVAGTSPMKADKSHIHHYLLKNGMSHKQSSLILYLANICILIAVVFLNQLSINTSIIVIISGGFGISILFVGIELRKEQKATKELITNYKSSISYNKLIMKI